MNKKFKVFLTFISILTVYVNLMHFLGFVEQTPMMSDINSILKYEDIAEVKEYLPNINATTIPIYENKLLYLLNSSKNLNIDSLINKLLKYNSPNPYLGLKERILADLYIKKGNYDSARYFFNSAFNKLPNNEIYNTNYFNLLADIRDSTGLKKAFRKVKKPAKISIKNYLNNCFRVYGYNHKYVTRLIDSLLIQFPEDEDFYELMVINKIGHSFYKKSQLEQVLAQNDFDNMDYINAIKGYKNAIELNPFNPILFENIAISYMKLKDFKKARVNFKRVIDSFDLKTGKSEFYYGVLNLEIDKKEACKYLKISNRLNFSGAEDFINKYCYY